MKHNHLFRLMLACSSALVLLMGTASCKKAEEPKPFDMAAAQKAIDECNTAFTTAFNKGDASGVANCYVADAKFMPPNSASKEGQAAINEEIANYFKAGVTKLEIKSVGLWGDDNLLVEENAWTIYAKDGKEIDHGKSLVSYKKDGESWKIFRDCYNSDMPCGGPPPAPEAAPAAPAAPKK